MPLFFFNNKKQKTYWQIGNVITIISTVIAWNFSDKIFEFFGGGENGELALGLFPFSILLWMYAGPTILEFFGVGKD